VVALPALYFSGDPDVGVLDCVRFGRVHFGRCSCRRTVENGLRFCCGGGGGRTTDNGWRRAELNMSAGRTLFVTAPVGVGGGRSCHVDKCLRFRWLDGAPVAMKL
jgi:hypothetical protein